MQSKKFVHREQRKRMIENFGIEEIAIKFQQTNRYKIIEMTIALTNQFETIKVKYIL